MRDVVLHCVVLSVAVAIYAWGPGPALAGAELALPSAETLVAVASRPFDLAKAHVALKQLRLRAEAGLADGQTLAPLVEARHLSWPLAGSYYRVLAAGGQQMEPLLLRKVNEESRYDLLAALALAEPPAADVTAGLREMARRSDLRPGTRALVALALAARGDRAQQWAEEVARYLRAASGDGEENERWLVWQAVACAAPKLRGEQALQEVLWQVAASGAGSERGWDALIACASAAPWDVEQVRVQELRAKWLASGDALPCLDRAIIHMALARLSAGPEADKDALLSAVGGLWDDPSYSGEAGRVLLFASELLINDPVARVIQSGLTAESRVTRLGAVRLAMMMGPDAKGMLDALGEVAAGADPAVAREARRARVLVGGLDAQGDWVFADDAWLLERL